MRIVCLGGMVLALTLQGVALNAQQAPPLGFFITSAGSGDGANLGGLSGADAHCQKLASAAGAGSRTWRAYLSEHGERQARQRQGPHRRRPVGQRQGRDRRAERRRTARREQADQRDPAHREGRRRERSWRHAEHARHPHRLAARWHGVYRRRRSHLQQLDEQRRPAARRSATTIARVVGPTRRRGTTRTPRRAAARPTLWPPAAPACSTASPRNSPIVRRSKEAGNGP